MTTTIEQIQNHEVYKQVLEDSCGGLMYDVSNYHQYDEAELLALWDSLSPAEQEVSGGITKGAMSFLKGE